MVWVTFLIARGSEQGVVSKFFCTTLQSPEFEFGTAVVVSQRAIATDGKYHDSLKFMKSKMWAYTNSFYEWNLSVFLELHFLVLFYYI